MWRRIARCAALLTAPSFPFPLLWLVHLSNRIRVHRPLGAVSDLTIGVHAENLQPHAKGATFEVVTTVEDALGLLWEARSRMLCRGVKLDGAAADDALPTPTVYGTRHEPSQPSVSTCRWRIST